MQICMLSARIWPEPSVKHNFLPKTGEVNTQPARAVCLLPMLAVCTLLQWNSQGPRENETLGAETSDAEEL